MIFNRVPQSLLITLSIAISKSQLATSEVQDPIRFQSSIVLPDRDDLSLLRGQSKHQRTHVQQGGLGIPHSCIDRDPKDVYDLDDESNLDVIDNVQDMPSQNQWKSPLEEIYPIHSRNHYDTVNFIPELPSTMIHDRQRHSHQILAPTANNPSSQNNLLSKTRKTGTTITALLSCNSTVLILAADTRATDGTTVADSNCEKLHQLARNVWCAGAGTSGDVEAIVRSVKFMFWKRGMVNKVGNMEMTVPPVTTFDNEEAVPSASLPAILHCLRTQLQKTRGQLGVNLLVGGYDHPSKRATLAAIHPHGSMDIVTYGALGSGGLAATGVLESRYPKIGSEHCTLEEGIRLAVDAIRAGVDNDLGSGSQVDVVIIAKEGVLYRRAVVKEEVLEWADGSHELTETNRIERLNDGGGVNGFGNVPFAIQSERVVISGELSTKNAKRQWLEEVLGIEEH
jgi:20S proteasome subunit beta 2